jgi:methyl-accepting chemotaxis protein
MALETVFLIVLLVSASALCLSMIFYLSRITKSIQKIETDVTNLSTQMSPLITSTVELSRNLSDLSDQAKEQLKSAKDIIGHIKERVDTILSLEEKIRSGIEEPVMGLLKNISAVTKGFNTFWNTYRRQ